MMTEEIKFCINCGAMFIETTQTHSNVCNYCLYYTTRSNTYSKVVGTIKEQQQ